MVEFVTRRRNLPPPRVSTCPPLSFISYSCLLMLLCCHTLNTFMYKQWAHDVDDTCSRQAGAKSRSTNCPVLRPKISHQALLGSSAVGEEGSTAMKDLMARVSICCGACCLCYRDTEPRKLAQATGGTSASFSPVFPHCRRALQTGTACI